MSGKQSKFGRGSLEEDKDEFSSNQSMSKTRAVTGNYDSKNATTSKKRKYDDVRDGRVSYYNTKFMVEDEDEDEQSFNH